MKLSKTGRENLLQEICNDIENWDMDTLIAYAKDLIYTDLSDLKDQDLIDETAMRLNYDQCDHCGHIDMTGACTYCKMD